jgi:hypothetical protein
MEQLARSGDLLTLGGTTFKLEVVDCPPPNKDGNRPNIWNQGESTKKDCPIDCTGE